MQSAVLQLTGNMTVVKSSKLPENVKAQIMAAAEGKVKSIRIPLTDSEGNALVLQGPCRISKKGSITASFSLQCAAFEILELDAEEKVEDSLMTVDELGKALLDS